MQPNPSPNPEEAAADWLARRDVGLTPMQEQEFAAWLAADPQHTAAWTELESLWRVLDHAQAHGLTEGMASELAARQRRRRWRVRLGWAGGGLAAAAAAVLFFVAPADRPAGPPPSAVRAVIFRPEHRVLEDGSVVELNRGAEIAVHYSAARREVRLLRGEALFAVAKNAARPFVVTTAGVGVRAVGTAFAVKRGEDAVDVLVTEGRVAVDRPAAGAGGAVAPAPQAPVFVAAGGRLVVPTTGAEEEELSVETISTEEMTRRLAWRGAQMDLSGTRLQDAVDTLNREGRTRITVADSALADLRLSGIFNANNAEAFVRILEDNPDWGIVAERRADEIVLRSR